MECTCIFHTWNSEFRTLYVYIYSVHLVVRKLFVYSLYLERQVHTYSVQRTQQCNYIICICSVHGMVSTLHVYMRTLIGK
jgi:hypothetical protein